ncbi:MAG: rhomboid family intramembrane serine protease [Chloroflexi bacterium]|nr:rhomboid family intramembrane serine protease [Chloroflexota bacterium]
MAGFFQDRQEEGVKAPLPGTDLKPIVTWGLLAVNIVIWLIMEAAGGSENPEVLLDFGAMYGPFIAGGEYWRLFTAMFLHVGLMHLLFNSFGLLIFGRLVERLYGHGRFITIYILAGLSGSVASYLFNSISIGAGASGAIFGVLGALGAFFLAKRDVLGDMGRQNLIGIAVIAAINLAIGAVTPGIDNWAHMGGLVAGFGIGFAFAPRYQYMPDVNPSGITYDLVDTNSVARRFWVLPIVGVVLIFGVLLGNSTLPENPQSHIQSAERLIEQQRYDEARDELDVARDLAFETRDGEALSRIGELRVSIPSLR